MFAFVLPSLVQRGPTVVAMTSSPASDKSSSTAPQRRAKSSPSKGRTSIVTAAAIAGVLLAGSAAVAANIGILNAADNSAIGELTATDDLIPAANANVDIATESTAAPTTTPASDVQQFQIEGIGDVWVMSTTSGLAVDHIVAASGWTATLSQTDLGSLSIDFTGPDRTVRFVAALDDNGRLVADVTANAATVAAIAAIIEIV